VPGKSFKRAGKIATGVVLGSALLGLHGDANPLDRIQKERTEYVNMKTTPTEFKSDYLKRGLESGKIIQWSEKEKKEIVNAERNANLMLLKIRNNQLSEKDINIIVTNIKEGLKSLAESKDPQIKVLHASILGVLAEIPKFIWSALKGSGRNFYNHPVFTLLTELVCLGLYLQIAKNIKMKRGALKIHDDYGLRYLKYDANNFERYFIVPALGVLAIPNVVGPTAGEIGNDLYFLGLMAGTITSPFIRYQILKFWQWGTRK